MRNRRIQKRRAIALEARQRIENALPDPFSHTDPSMAELVETEQEREYQCPCCMERSDDHELAAYEMWYLKGKQNDPV